MKPIRVRLGERSYDICFGPLKAGFAKKFESVVSNATKALIVTSDAVARAGHAGVVAEQLRKLRVESTTVVLPNGEQNKNLKTISDLYQKGFIAGLDRRSVVVAVGGGVITDMAGFFAATYMRGVPFVSVPTTILGMVDAAIGGKTGVDVPEGKNLVGAFWQPRFVWIDADVLNTLPEREWRTGFAEVIKYGVIKSRPFFGWLERRIHGNPRFSSWPREDIDKALYDSARIKAIVVSGDEREMPLKGGREILNFGHTSGHALEAATGYRALSHGEAISIGMVYAGKFALEQGMWSEWEQIRMALMLSTAGLPIHFPKLSAMQTRRFWSALMKDKKNVAGSLRFVLPETIGKVGVYKLKLSSRSFQ